MPSFLKGNYRLPKAKHGRVARKAAGDLTDQFEKSVLAKLGGSLCFVTKKTKFIWTGEDDGATGTAAH